APLTLDQPFGGRGRDARTRTKPENTAPSVRCELAALINQVDASHSLGQGLALQPRQPDEWHAVWYGQVGSIDRFLESCIARSDAQEVQVDRHDLVRRAGDDKTFDPLNCGGAVDQ